MTHGLLFTCEAALRDPLQPFEVARLGTFCAFTVFMAP